MTKHILSKSTFMFGCQCPKRLYYHKRRPDLRNEEDEQQQNVFAAGTSIGELARKLFPGGRNAAPIDPYSYHVSVDYTQELIDRGDTIIYEAAFQFDGVLCALDILVKKGDAWYAFEVKSSTGVKSQYIQDAALQYFVVSNSGLPLADISIVYLNNQYVRKGELEIPKLFAAESILEDVLKQQIEIAAKIKELKNIIMQPNEPEVDIGPHCSNPYPCDFTDQCWKHMPVENSIFDLSRGPGWKLYEAGYRHLDDIPMDFEMGGNASMQLEHYRSGETHINMESLSEFLQPITYPLYFFDFETINPGIPEFDDSRPYQQIPFQYSLHIKRTPEAELEHKEFLGDGLTDPRAVLMQNMLTDLENTGSIVCYNMTFEKSRIKDLARVYPQFEKELLAINERVIDLMIPFSRRWYYHPNFKGSYSIKAVLPVIIPDLRYTDLEIQEGGTASLVYGQLKNMNPADASLYRNHLLAYCKMDTLAMVKIWEFLEQLVQSHRHSE